MPLLVRTRITAVEPPALALTVQGKARVRVRGQVCGFVQCAGQRRWAWGTFDETFQLTRERVEPSSRRGRQRRDRGQDTVRVRAFGLGGLSSQLVRFLSSVDLTLARPRARGKLRWTRPRVPAISALSAHAIRTVGGAEET